MIANMLMFVAIAVVGGLGSSWYMIERGSRLTTHAFGPWIVWHSAGRADADPYTRAHYMRRGMLPVSTAIAVTFEAIADSQGQRLHSSCEYALEGAEPPAKFWSISVFDEHGRLIPNPADRFSYNSATALRGPGGSFSIALARVARAGNWLPTGGAGRLSLVLIVEELQDSAAAGGTQNWQPPEIKRVTCR